LAEIHHWAVVFGQILALAIRVDSSKGVYVQLLTDEVVLGTPDAIGFVGTYWKESDMSPKPAIVRATLARPLLVGLLPSSILVFAHNVNRFVVP
jgi:hypothetical protein